MEEKKSIYDVLLKERELIKQITYEDEFKKNGRK